MKNNIFTKYVFKGEYFYILKYQIFTEKSKIVVSSEKFNKYNYFKTTNAFPSEYVTASKKFDTVTYDKLYNITKKIADNTVFPVTFEEYTENELMDLVTL